MVGWSTVSGKYGFGTALCDPMKRNYATGDAKCQRILGKDGELICRYQPHSHSYGWCQARVAPPACIC